MANIKSIFQHVSVCIPVVNPPSGSTSQLNCQWFWLLGFQSVPVAQACITLYSFYSLPHALLCTRHLFVWYLRFFLLALPWGFVIGFLQFIGYYFTFAQKFKFQCDWCMGSLGACGRVAGSACHVGGLTLMYIMGFRLQGECWACFSWVPNLHLWRIVLKKRVLLLKWILFSVVVLKWQHCASVLSYALHLRNHAKHNLFYIPLVCRLIVCLSQVCHLAYHSSCSAKKQDNSSKYTCT